MSANVKLPCTRFVKRVSNGASLSKYGYIGMMMQNAEALKSAPWRIAASRLEDTGLTTNQLTKTDGKFDADAREWEIAPSYTAYFDDRYDAFAQAGDAVAANATFCGYAGCAAYRFELPRSAGSNPLEALSFVVQRDRYLRAGLRIAACLSNSATPSDDWSVVRGEAEHCLRTGSEASEVEGASAWGCLAQSGVAYLTLSSPQSLQVTLEAGDDATFAAAADYSYLYVYVTLEDYAGRWTLYKQDTPRMYYIEGSGMLVAARSLFAFESQPASGATSAEFVAAEGYGAANVLLPNDVPVKAFDTATMCACAMAYLNGMPRIVAAADGEDRPPLRDAGRCQEPANLLGSVRQAYAMFAAGQMASPSLFRDEPEGDLWTRALYVDEGVPGASFCVCANPNLARSGEEKRLGGTLLSRRIALHRFALPVGFAPEGVRFEWEPVASAGNVRLNAWMALGKELVEYGAAEVAATALYTAATAAVGPWRLVASIVNSADRQTAGVKDFTTGIPFAVPPGAIATMLLTAYAEPEDSEFEAGDVLGMTKTLGGGDVAATAVATAGWRPRIVFF